MEERRKNKNDTVICWRSTSFLLAAAYSEVIDPADLIEDTVTIGLYLVFQETNKTPHVNDARCIYRKILQVNLEHQH